MGFILKVLSILIIVFGIAGFFSSAIVGGSIFVLIGIMLFVKGVKISRKRKEKKQTSVSNDNAGSHANSNETQKIETNNIPISNSIEMDIEKESDDHTSPTTDSSRQISNNETSRDNESGSKIEASLENSFVEVLCPNGQKQSIPTSYLLHESNHCLFCNGKKYHLYAGCHLGWPVEFRKDFHGYTVITKTEAEAKGIGLCSFCEGKAKMFKKNGDTRQLSGLGFVNMMANAHQHLFCKLTGTSSSEIKEAIDCVAKGDEISLSMDYDKEKYAVEAYTGIIGWLTKSDSKKVEDIAEANNKIPECLVGYIADKYVPESGSAYAEVLILFDDNISIKPVDFKEDGTDFTFVEKAKNRV